MINWAAIREEFPALRRWTYLNTATYGQLPRRAQDAVARHFARREEYACSDFLEWFDEADRVRALAARLVNCQPEDIAFFPNACSALAQVTSGIDWRPGDRALTLDYEFPNLLYAGAMLSERGVVFDQASWDDFEKCLTPRTRLVMASTVNYITGFRLPVERLVKLSRQAGAFVYVDGTQSVGALCFDCEAIQPDMLSVDGYKWLLCPNGAGFAYIRPEVRRWLPPLTIGWRSDRRWREVNSLHHGKPEFTDAAERYEGGMLPFPAILAMGESIQLMLEIGPEVIERRVLDLAAYVAQRLAGVGGKILYSETPIVAVHLEAVDVENLVAQLRTRRILVSARHGRLRVSPHFYNTLADIDQLVDNLS
ncbi:MAG: aminotransferase class V-fold PLP-dependent enzyme [Bryobacteraceae bacterium]|nr:aminotransferase class V-fold PLP-dependent enzyme [Bryobacteraceae bacterium]MDW8378875.1 aminotransferase class V-fold PLP-dependent enzyme [Bryobacterales bacterium]